MISLYHYLTVSVILFCIGTFGVLTRKNAIVIFMCIELMLNGVNLAFIAFSRYLGDAGGQIFVFFVMGVSAAEALVGLALVVAFFRNRESVNVEEFNLLKW